MTRAEVENDLRFACSTLELFLRHHAAFAAHVSRADVDDDPVYVAARAELARGAGALKRKQPTVNRLEGVRAAMRAAALTYSVLIEFCTPAVPSQDSMLQTVLAYLRAVEERRKVEEAAAAEKAEKVTVH